MYFFQALLLSLALNLVTVSSDSLNDDRNFKLNLEITLDDNLDETNQKIYLDGKECCKCSSTSTSNATSTTTTTTTTTIKPTTTTTSKPRADCSEYLENLPSGSTLRGVKTVYIKNQPVQTFCTDDGWTVIQSRGQFKNPKDFFSSKLWNDYKVGFGTPGEEYWMGLENIYQITNSKAYSLRITMKNFESPVKKIATYKIFTLTENVRYTLQISGFSGDAGDSLEYQNGQKFTTRDSDNDSYGPDNCAIMYQGAWWHNQCHRSNLNGYNFGPGVTPFAVGLVWHSITNYYYSLETVEMAIKAL